MNILNNKLKIYLYFFWTINLLKAFLTISSIFVIGLFFSPLVNGDWKQFLNYFFIDLVICVTEVMLLILNKFFKNYLVKKISQQYQKHFIQNLFLLKNRPEEIKGGDITSKLLKTIPNIIQSTIFELGNFYVSILVLIAIIAVLSYYSIIIMLITISCVLLLLISTFFISKWISVKTTLQQNIINNSDGEFDIFINSYHKFFFFFKTKFLNFQLEKINTTTNWKLNKLNEQLSILDSVNFFLNVIFQIILSTIVLVLYIFGLLPLSSIVSIPFLFGLSGEYFHEVSSSLTSYKSFTKVKNQLFLIKNIKTTQMKQISKLEFKEFNFGTSKNQYTKNQNLIFEKNKKYLIIGKSGAGKSRLVNQLFLNKKQHHGEIFINGNDKFKYTENEIIKHLLFIDSKMELIPTSIKENIFLNRNISDKKIKTILKELNLSEQILTKDFSKVSQGEKQRIILASVLLEKPKWLIIDEGLSNLDKDTFIKLNKYLTSQKNLSLIHISHSKHHKEVWYDKIFQIN